MELSNYLSSWVVTYLGDLQPTYIGVIFYLLSSMDILVYMHCNAIIYCLVVRVSFLGVQGYPFISSISSFGFIMLLK